MRSTSDNVLYKTLWKPFATTTSNMKFFAAFWKTGAIQTVYPFRFPICGSSSETGFPISRTVNSSML